MLVLYLIQHCIPVKHLAINDNLTTRSGGNPKFATEQMENEYLYVLGNLLSQGWT